MSMQSLSKVKGLIVVLVTAIAVLLLLRPALFNSPTSASAPDPAPLTSASLGTDTYKPLGALDSTDTSTPTATPASTATATPVPNNYIWIPWRSQFDGSAYASSNCGPASLGMAMSYYGEWWSTAGIRKSTNERSGVVGLDDGTDWPSLAYAAEKRGFTVVGLYDSAGNYRKWTIADLVKETDQERPVILLVRFRALPGHAGSSYYGDHYIVFLGLMADGRVVYHDPAFYEEIDGSYRIMGQETLLEAWGNTSVGQQYTAMSLVWEHEARKWDGN
ncbi:MAG: C39 family peptidase [Chloroflexota bacterium]